MDREHLVEIIRACGSLEEAAWKFHVRPSTLNKVLSGQPISSAVAIKIKARLETRFGIVSTSVVDLLMKGLSRPGFPERQLTASKTERLLRVHRLYEQQGTLAAVGRKLGITRERVRQLLVQGTRLGLFTYLPRDVRVEGRKEKCVNEYNLITQQLGHHPTTTEIQRKRAWRYLSIKINRLWGSIDNFRRELNVPIPRKGNPRFSEDVRKWRQYKHEIALIRRMEHLDRIRECLKMAGTLSAKEIAAECNLKLPRVWFLLNLLRTTGEIVRTVSNFTKYKLTSGRKIR